MLILDHEMLDYMDRLAPEMGVYDLDIARKISNNLTMPAPVVATTAAYIGELDHLLPAV
jgi:hypothetical protein